MLPFFDNLKDIWRSFNNPQIININYHYIVAYWNVDNRMLARLLLLYVF